jgi:hypothetical protein
MFENANSFNQNLSSWDVANVENTTRMFGNATSFNQNPCPWGIAQVDVADMFLGSGCDEVTDPDLSTTNRSWVMSVVTTSVHRTMPMLCLLSMEGSIGCHDPLCMAKSLISIDYYKHNNYDNNYNLQSGPITMTLFSWSGVKMRIVLPIQNELP